LEQGANWIDGGRHGAHRQLYRGGGRGVTEIGNFFQRR
jgi:hypothetical protein